MATYKMTQTTEEFQQILDDSASVLKAASLSVGCELEQIILATDTTTQLDDILYIYDATEQVTYAKPSTVGAGEVIVEVTASTLTTDAASYYLSPLVAPSKPIFVQEYGVVGDGVEDDTDAYNLILTNFVGREIDSSGLTAIRITGQVSFPDGTILKTGKTPFLVDYTQTSSAAAVINAGAFEADTLRVTLTTGNTFNRPIGINGGDNDVVIGSIFCESVDQINNRTSQLDAAVQIRTPGAIIHLVKVKNFDNGVLIGFADDIVVRSICVKNYVRGVYHTTADNINIGQINTKTASVNATTDPGHNGVLIENLTNSQWGNMNLQNAGEHAFRIGGDIGELTENLSFGNIMAIKPGQCGVKVNPDSLSRARGLTFGDITAVDCATGNATGSNEDTLRLESCHDVTISSVTGLFKDKANCGYDFIYLNYVNRVVIGTATCSLPLRSAVYVDDSRGEVSDVTIGMLDVNKPEGTVLTVSSPTESFYDFAILSGFARDLVADSVPFNFTMSNTTGGVPSPFIFRMDMDVGNYTSASTVTADDLVASNSTGARIYNRLEVFA